MALQHPNYAAEEIARRGDEIYDRQVRAQVEAGNESNILAIDVQSGAYAVGETALAAIKLATTGDVYTKGQKAVTFGLSDQRLSRGSQYEGTNRKH
jgi:hypothetical protein